MFQTLLSPEVREIITFCPVRIRYNSPVVLSYTFLCLGLYLINHFIFPHFTEGFLTNYPGIEWKNPLWYWRLLGHGLGHSNPPHLLGNFSLILLLGPMLEEKYGSKPLLSMILITIMCTGLLNCLFFSTGLLGASGVVFCFITLASFTNIKPQEIPLTFVLVALLFLSKEILGIFKTDQVSQFAHILGGIAGGVFGYFRR